MQCQETVVGDPRTYKLVDTPKNKKLYYRSEGKWIEFCIKLNEIYKHYGDGAECINNFSKNKSYVLINGEKVFLEDYTEFWDFILYTKGIKFHKSGKTNKHRCRKLK